MVQRGNEMDVKKELVEIINKTENYNLLLLILGIFKGVNGKG